MTRTMLCAPDEENNNKCSEKSYINPYVLYKIENEDYWMKWEFFSIHKIKS